MNTTKLTSLALAFTLGLALPMTAQETTAETPTVEGGASASTDLAMGVELGAAPAEGDSYVAATFEDWEQRCIKTASGVDPCQLYQLLRDGDGNAVAEFMLFTLPEGASGPAVMGATFIAPLETLLGAGLSLQVDTSKARAYPFTFCSSIGCVARIGFTAEEVAQFKKGGATTLVIVPFVAPDQKVVLTASLKGFTAGIDAVTASNKLADEAAKAAPPAVEPAVEPAPAEN